ncbi:MAG: hypothetical protein M0Q95_14565 [Porticoccaceae bacterium]|nr:hypothetical protein [Porticoccaceae bacterium]
MNKPDFHHAGSIPITQMADHKSSKSPYTSPALQRFGKVHELTQSASGSCMADNTSGCTPAVGNMAMS